MDDAGRTVTIEELLRHSEWLRSLARILAGPTEASDVEQETWLAALERPPRERTSPRAWLAQVLRNVVRRQRRAETARRMRELASARPEAVPQDESVERARALRELVDEMLALDEPYRSALLRHHQDGLSAEDIACELGVPASTVRSRIARGRALLRERLVRRGGRDWRLLIAPLFGKDGWVAPVSTGAAAASLVMAGGTAMSLSKLAAAAAAVVLVAAGWFAFVDRAAEPTISAPTVGSAEQLSAPTAAAEIEGSTRTPIGNVASNEKAAAATSTTGSVVVSVTWESDGSVSRGALVSLRAAGEAYWEEKRMALTDAHGRVRFDEIAPGIARASVFGGGLAEVEILAGVESRLAIAIPPGIAVHGRVVDESERPVPYARIWLSGYSNDSLGHEVARADERGEFRLRDVGPSRCVAARAAGHGPSNSVSVPGEANDEVEIVLVLLGSGGELRGVVREPGGTSIADAVLTVGFDAHGVSNDWSQSSAPPARVRSDEGGEFAVDGLAPGASEIRCRATGFAPARLPVEISPDGITRFDVVLDRGATVVGIVRDSSGEPVPDAKISGTSRAGGSSTKSAADGTFRLELLPEGEVKLLAIEKSAGSARDERTLRAGETARWDPDLRTLGRVAGRLVDERGEPLSGYWMAAIRGQRPGLFLREDHSGPEGEFQLDDWPAEADAIEVREHGRLTGFACRIFEGIEPGTTDLVLVLPDAARATAYLLGRIRGPEGEALPRARMSYGVRGSGRAYWPEHMSATGEFRAGPIVPGRYEIQFDEPEMGRKSLGEFDVEAGDTIDLGEVRFERSARVRLELGGPAELLQQVVNDREKNGLVVCISEVGDPWWLNGVQLDAAGRGTSAALQPGRYEIRVKGRIVVTAAHAIDLAAGEVLDFDLQLERAATRDLELLWTGTSDREERYEAAYGDERGERGRVTNPMFDGTAHLELPGLGPGVHWVEVTYGGGRTIRETFTVDDVSRPLPPLELRLGP